VFKNINLFFQQVPAAAAIPLAAPPQNLGVVAPVMHPIAAPIPLPAGVPAPIPVAIPAVAPVPVPIPFLAPVPSPPAAAAPLPGPPPIAGPPQPILNPEQLAELYAGLPPLPQLHNPFVSFYIYFFCL